MANELISIKIIYRVYKVWLKVKEGKVWFYVAVKSRKSVFNLIVGS